MESTLLFSGCTSKKDKENEIAKQNNQTLLELRDEFKEINKELINSNLIMTNERVLVPSSFDFEDENAKLGTYALFTKDNIKYDENFFVNYNLAGETEGRKYFYTFYKANENTFDDIVGFNIEDMYSFLSLYIIKENENAKIENCILNKADSGMDDSFKFGRYQAKVEIDDKVVFYDEFVLVVNGQDEVLVCIVDSDEDNQIPELPIDALISYIFDNIEIKY